MTDVAAPVVPDVAFKPRRLGHVNMYVSDLDASYAFYHDVCGLELGFDEPGLMAKFLSNGNSHHDIAIGQASDRTLVGRDGKVQKSASRGNAAGLNHLAFEMATEADLVAGIRRVQASGYGYRSLYDHIISRSIYFTDPDGVEVEVYADNSPDWRGIYASLGTELMSSRWEPEADGPASTEERFVKDFVHQPVAGAPARPLRTSRVTLIVPHLERAVAFYRAFVGLAVMETDEGAGRWAVMSGTLGRPDLFLVESAGEPCGFHHFSLELPDRAEVDATAERLSAAGVRIAARIDHARKHSVVIIDPDGVGVEFFADGDDPTVPYRRAAAGAPRAYAA